MLANFDLSDLKKAWLPTLKNIYFHLQYTWYTCNVLLKMIEVRAKIKLGGGGGGLGWRLFDYDFDTSSYQKREKYMNKYVYV